MKKIIKKILAKIGMGLIYIVLFFFTLAMIIFMFMVLPVILFELIGGGC